MRENTKTIFEKLTYQLQQFLHQEAAGGILLIFCTLAAMILTNSFLADHYSHFWHTYISVTAGEFTLSYTVHHWINDGLMVVFFFVVGLEIKRELISGELSSAKKAALPIAAALGGMILPAAIYFSINSGSEGSSGWGIPMATDIAFVVGILAILGRRVPLSLKIFILALAIVDDIGAVLVIALFYTAEISLNSLMVAGVIILVLLSMNRAGVRSLLLYSLAGIILWLAFLKSGVHATVAGVILAFTIPASSKIDTESFSGAARSLLNEFDETGSHAKNVLNNGERLSIISQIENSCEKIQAPLQKFEHILHPWVSFFIMPIFALANAGVAIESGFHTEIASPVSIGIIAGLFFGKQIGIFSFSYLAIKSGLAEKPEGVSWLKIYGASILGGIGFTMSLFIANLAFTSDELLSLAKIGVITGSLVSGITGFAVLKYARK